MKSARLKLVESTESIDIRVCNIVFRSDPEHEFRAVQAIRAVGTVASNHLDEVMPDE